MKDPLRFMGLWFFSAILCAAALAQGLPSQGFGNGGSASIVVYVRQYSGQAFRTMPQVSLESPTIPLAGSTPGSFGSGVIFRGLPLGGYTVTARYPGFKPGSEDVELDWYGETQTVVIFLHPEDESSDAAGSETAGSAMVPPSVQKEVQKAVKELASKHKDYAAARKHLEKALRDAPDSYQVNYLIGITYIWPGDWKGGEPYLKRAKVLNPKYVPTLTALASTCSALGDYAGSIESAAAAVELEPSDWKAQWILADGYLRSRQFDQAREHASLAVETGKEQAGGAQLILGESLAALGRREEAATVLESYLKQHPDSSNASAVRRFVSSLREPSRTDAPAKADPPAGTETPAPLTPAISRVPPPAPKAEIVKAPWVPLDVDAVHPPVDGGVLSSYCFEISRQEVSAVCRQPAGISSYGRLPVCGYKQKW